MRKRDETLGLHSRGRTGTMLFWAAMSVLWVVATITLQNHNGLAAALLLFSFWNGWLTWQTGLYAGPSGVRIVRPLGIGILSFIRTVRVAWIDIDRFEFRPGGRASYFAQLIRTSDQRAIEIQAIVYPRDETSRFYTKWHPAAQARLDELNELLQASQTPSANNT
jgi:hypothetical protein